jgi:hypothetical protein
MRPKVEVAGPRKITGAVGPERTRSADCTSASASACPFGLSDNGHGDAA